MVGVSLGRGLGTRLAFGRWWAFNRIQRWRLIRRLVPVVRPTRCLRAPRAALVYLCILWSSWTSRINSHESECSRKTPQQLPKVLINTHQMELSDKLFVYYPWPQKAACIYVYNIMYVFFQCMGPYLGCRKVVVLKFATRLSSWWTLWMDRLFWIRSTSLPRRNSVCCVLAYK